MNCSPGTRNRDLNEIPSVPRCLCGELILSMAGRPELRCHELETFENRRLFVVYSARKELRTLYRLFASESLEVQRVLHLRSSQNAGDLSR